MVGPVLKIKTGFRGFESEQNPGFESYRDMRKSFTRAYMSYIINRKFANLISKLEDRSQKKKIMFLHSKNKASRKGYKGEC